MIRVGLDLDLLQLLVKNKTPASVSELATKTVAALTLLARVFRYLASIGVIKEIGKDTFASNNITGTLTLPGAPEDGRNLVDYFVLFLSCFDTCYPVWQALPNFVRGRKYQGVGDVTDTALQKAWNMDLPLFSWYQTKPENLAKFN
ncbi:hypothetical protein BJX99DRAFT_257585 [Aspergillus californicus]